MEIIQTTHMYVALTFDDGTVHQYNMARLLSERGIRCTLFCVTHLKRFPDTDRQLIVNEPRKIRDLHYLGHEIASHTCTHPDLRLLTPERLGKELGDSKRKLESIIEDEVLGFAYPYGLCSVDVLEKVKKEYFYARGGPLQEDPWNINTRDRYRIGSVGVKKIMMLPFAFAKNKPPFLIAIMMHDIPRNTLLSLVYYMRIVFRADFVNMKEMADMLAEEE